eukprot:s1259_g1.t2
MADGKGMRIARAGVAVLFAGSWRYEERTLASLARHLVRPLSATVLCALSGSSGSRGWRERQQMKKFFPALAGFRWLHDVSEAELRKAIAPKALLLYETFGGGAVSPLRRNKLGGQLHSLRKMQIVWQMTKSYERKRRRRFRWVIYSRLDLIWVANHPPLQFLEPPDGIWTVPLAGAQGHQDGIYAVNDWHGTVPRQWAEAYFGRWWMLRKGVIWQPYLEPEELLASVCFWMDIPVGIFDAVFSLSGCRKWSCQFEFRDQPQRWRLPLDVPVLRQRAQRLREGARWERTGERTLEIREKKMGEARRYLAICKLLRVFGGPVETLRVPPTWVSQRASVPLWIPWRWRGQSALRKTMGDAGDGTALRTKNQQTFAMSQRLRWARFLQMPAPAEPGMESAEGAGVEMPKWPRGRPRRPQLPFPALAVMDLWERGTGHPNHEGHEGHGTHHGHHGHEAQVVQHVGSHREMTHLEHHGSHEDSMSDLGLALISSGTTIFLAMISAIFAMRLFREMLRPQATAGAQGGGQGDMQGVLQLEIPGVQPFRPFSGQGHRLVMEADKDDATGGAAASGEQRDPR